MTEIQKEQNINTSNNTSVEENQPNDEKKKKFITIGKKCIIIGFFLIIFSLIFFSFSVLLEGFLLDLLTISLSVLIIIGFFLLFIGFIFILVGKYNDRRWCCVIGVVLFIVGIFSIRVGGPTLAGIFLGPCFIVYGIDSKKKL